MEVGELFFAALRRRGEEERARLVEALAGTGLREGLGEVARRVGGDAPDTVFVTVAAEVVAAAAALRPGVRVVAPSEPEPGWGPLQRLLEILEAEGLARVYRMPMRPGGRLRAWDVARRAGRMARGLSARLVDVTDAPPPVVAGLYGGGVRLLTVLVDMGYTAVFQRFGYM